MVARRGTERTHGDNKLNKILAREESDRASDFRHLCRRRQRRGGEGGATAVVAISDMDVEVWRWLSSS